jgi:RNA polymerase sigma-70 factor (ECF subfamily)
MRYLKNLHDAEEMMQNGFFNFFRSIDRFIYNGKGSVGAWLKKIMVNECLMHLRKKGLKIVNEQMAEGVETDGGQVSKMHATEIYRLVLDLPEGYRTVFNLFAVEGYSHREIAAMLGISEGTSKSQLSKARLMLQKVIKERAL